MEMFNELVNQQIRITPENPRRVSVFDAISAITGNLNPRDAWYSICKLHPDITNLTSKHKFEGRGQRETPVIEERHIPSVARKALCAARMPLEEKKRRMESFCCDMEGVELEMKMITEEEIMQQLEEAFEACNPIKQFGIGPYRIDMYLDQPKIALECDEHNHSSYNTVREMQRQTFIEERLGCCFIRFDPYAPNFSAMSVVKEVVRKLAQ